MANDVTVGVVRWAGDQRADEDHPATAEVQQHWVRIGDVVLTAEHHRLLDVSYGVPEPGGFGEVTIRVGCSSFRTADKDELDQR